ncbi:cupredoxin family copper-binding protein [Mesorhizobium sp. 1M-11]|uniref:cupredoxin domain-containing protein n=1 Tax=Mesorhizobium sp. 1M-11 TaxID=1529006 RepID=UPI0006C76B0E|nr:cupredoxin family copper-binding protein [Mesorhizobium sp. 1M-11]
MSTHRRLLPVVVLALGTGPLSAHAETITVTIEKMAFSPAEISASVGDTVQWVNKDTFAHTATVKGGWEVMLPVAKSGSVVLDKAGTLDYFCRFHPNMKGRITVSAP